MAMSGKVMTSGFFLSVRPFKENPYYANVYREFKKDFNDIPHVIGGWQSKEINDPAIIGGVDRIKFDDLLRNLRVMYYHSHEPHHVHYHPLEAMAMGMPVVFMQEGMLGQIDKNGNQPGACKTISEARKKIRRVLDGDNKFAHEIRSAQKRLLIPFTYAYCFTEWQKNFIPGTEEKPVSQISEVKRIAVMLPLQDKSGTFDAAKAIAKMIHHGSRKAGTPSDVIFSFLRGLIMTSPRTLKISMSLGYSYVKPNGIKSIAGPLKEYCGWMGSLRTLNTRNIFFPAMACVISLMQTGGSSFRIA